jgi:hypothetical protein
MSFVKGDSIHEFLRRDPPQELRDRFGEKLLRAWYRLFFAGRMNYVDWHPGNFLFAEDGRLGIIDFGCVVEHTDEEWELLRLADRGLTTGRREDRIPFLKKWTLSEDGERDRDFLELLDRYAEWSWRGRSGGGLVDFGDGESLRRGLEIFAEMVRRRYARSRPSTPLINRWDLGFRAFLYRLGARVDLRRIAEEEVRAPGWDRSDYAPA